jgi:hypothetical protein
LFAAALRNRKVYARVPAGVIPSSVAPEAGVKIPPLTATKPARHATVKLVLVPAGNWVVRKTDGVRTTRAIAGGAASAAAAAQSPMTHLPMCPQNLGASLQHLRRRIEP